MCLNLFKHFGFLCVFFAFRSGIPMKNEAEMLQPVIIEAIIKKQATEEGIPMKDVAKSIKDQ
jgi:hypothetical protein